MQARVRKTGNAFSQFTIAAPPSNIQGDGSCWGILFNNVAAQGAGSLDTNASDYGSFGTQIQGSLTLA